MLSQKQKIRFAMRVSVIAFALLFILPMEVQATSSLRVNTLADTNDGSCDDTSCSLREAIAASDPGGHIHFAPHLTGTIALTAVTSELGIFNDLRIDGPGSNTLTISGSNETRIFHVNDNVHFELRDVTLANGFDFSIGGALLTNEGARTELTNVVLENNQTAGSAGAIFNQGSLVLRRSVVRNNRAVFIGGGIQMTSNAEMEVVDSVIEGNQVGNLGGGIVYGGTRLDIRNSIIQGNRVLNTTFGGGGLAVRAPGVTITHSTIQNNSAFNGAGIYNEVTLPALVRHTIISNPDGNTNCYSVDVVLAPVVDGGHNQQFPGTSCGSTIPVVNPG